MPVVSPFANCSEPIGPPSRHPALRVLVTTVGGPTSHGGRHPRVPGEPDSAAAARTARDAGIGTLSPVTPGAVVTWAARVTWLATALLGGAAFGDALSDHSRAVQLDGDRPAVDAVGRRRAGARRAVDGVAHRRADRRPGRAGRGRASRRRSASDEVDVAIAGGLIAVMLVRRR